MGTPTDLPVLEVLDELRLCPREGLDQVLGNARWVVRAVAGALGRPEAEVSVRDLIHLLHTARRRQPTGLDAVGKDQRKKALSVLAKIVEHALWSSMLRPLGEFPEDTGFPPVGPDLDGLTDRWAMSGRTALRLLFTITFAGGGSLKTITPERIATFEETFRERRPESFKSALRFFRRLAVQGADHGWLPDWGIEPANGRRVYTNPRADLDTIPTAVMDDYRRLARQADWSESRYSTAEVNEGVFRRYLRHAHERNLIGLHSSRTVAETLSVEAIVDWIENFRDTNGHGDRQTTAYNQLLPLCTLAREAGLREVSEALRSTVAYMRRAAGPLKVSRDALPTAKPLLGCVNSILAYAEEVLSETPFREMPSSKQAHIASLLRDATMIAAFTLFPMRNKNWRAATLDDLRIHDSGCYRLWVEPARRGKGAGLGGRYEFGREFTPLIELYLGLALPLLQRLNGERSRHLWQTRLSGSLSITTLSEILERRTRQLLGRGYRSHLFRHSFLTSFISWSNGNFLSAANLMLASDIDALERHYIAYNGSDFLRAHDTFTAEIGLERIRHTEDDDASEPEAETEPDIVDDDDDDEGPP